MERDLEGRSMTERIEIRPFAVLDYLIPLIVLVGSALSLLIDPLTLAFPYALLALGFAGGYLVSRLYLRGSYSSLDLMESLARERLKSFSHGNLRGSASKQESQLELVFFLSTSMKC
jgi:hypothetical protein